MSKSLCYKWPSNVADLKGFRCLHLNCCSIIKKIDQIRCTLINETNFEYYCFTESWLKPDIDSALFEVHDYTLIRNDRSLVTWSGSFVHGGSIICYVKNSLTFEIFDKPHTSVDLEMIVVMVNRLDQRRLYLINVPSAIRRSGNCFQFNY